MASKLDAALAWAARNFRVFPLQENSKLPLDQGWTVAASTDPAVIRTWWQDPVTGVERDYNVGFLTSHHVVLDVDTKAGKRGLDELMRLGLEVYDTLATRTPTGGYHLIFGGIGREVGQAPLAPGIDVRSHNGYVVAPGSEVNVVDGDGEPTANLVDLSREVLDRRLNAGAKVRRDAYCVEIDTAVADFPHELRPLLKAPRSRRVDGVSVELDQPESLEMAAYWLARDAEVAVQGENGDDSTYKVACRVRDFGVSEPATLDLMLDEWNARCEPPWDAGELAMKVENAFRYATGGAGSASPAVLFESVVDVPPPGGAPCVTISVPGQGIIRYGNAMDELDIPPRPWIVPGILMQRNMTLLQAPGGAGKSLLSLTLAAHLAVGRPFWGYKIEKPGKSIIYNAEDDLAEVSRRLVAICRLYQIDVRAATDKICLLGSDDIDLQVTKSSPPIPRQDHIDMLRDAFADPELQLFSVDPLVEVHTGRENDAIEMKFVMTLVRQLARGGDVGIMLVHHTAKASSTQVQAGDQNAGRGSTAIPNACRVGLSLETAKDADMPSIGAPLADRRRYVRLDGAKASYAAAPNTANWLRWDSYTIMSGDDMGVLMQHDAVAARAEEAARISMAVYDLVIGQGRASMPHMAAVEALASRGIAPTRAAGGDMEKRVELAFAEPHIINGGTLALRTNPEGLPKGKHFVLY